MFVYGLNLNTGALIGIIVAVVILLIIIGIVGWYISTRNRFIRLEQNVESSESRIDVYLTKRFDLLTKMLDTTKGYMKHEKETLIDVIEMRNPGAKASLQEKAQFNEQMNEAAKQLNLVVERYPELKADRMFDNLQNSISEVEENLQAARSNFNSNVKDFNQAILQFPASLVAGSKYNVKRNILRQRLLKSRMLKWSFNKR